MLSDGEGNGNPLQYSCLENSRDGGAWWAAVYGVAKSWTRLKRLSSSSNVKWHNLKYRQNIFHNAPRQKNHCRLNLGVFVEEIKFGKKRKRLSDMFMKVNWVNSFEDFVELVSCHKWGYCGDVCKVLSNSTFLLMCWEKTQISKHSHKILRWY